MKTFDDRKKCVQNHIQKIQMKRRKALITATSTTLVLAILALVLFIPYDTTPPDVSRYAVSEYYGLIQRINTLSYQPPKHTNRFEAAWDVLSNFGKKGTSEWPAPGADNLMQAAPTTPNASPDGDQYVEVTDNQVQGVVEADIFKRSDKYVFYLRGAHLSVYSINKAESQLVGTHDVGYEEDGSMKNWAPLHYLSSTEMYLSQDCRTITVLLQGFHKDYDTVTVLVNLDVSDPTKIKEVNRVYFVGSYLSSRMVDGDLLLTYNYGFRLSDVDFDDPATFVPQYGTPDNMTCIPGENIIHPDDISAARYTVVCKLNAQSLEVEDAVALLGYSQELYVSSDTIYATRTYGHKEQAAASNQYRSRTMTEIAGISYVDDGLELLGTITVEGAVGNQYSMDQYEGVLRVVTSTMTSYIKTYENGNGDSVHVSTSPPRRNVNLYCIDLENWQIAAEVIAFAPDGEDAQSVRFDGVYAYVCTAEVITFTDPVYFFNLSDLQNITWTDTGTIDGYSTSLIQLGDGYLLGIGYGSGRFLKIEVYEEYQGQVISVCTYERKAYFSEEYKSYLVDREQNLIGLAVQYYDVNGTKHVDYVLLHFDGYQLREVAQVESIYGDKDKARAFLADGWLYVLSFDRLDILAQEIFPSK